MEAVLQTKEQGSDIAHEGVVKDQTGIDVKGNGENLRDTDQL